MSSKKTVEPAMELTEEERELILKQPMAQALYDGWRLWLMSEELEEIEGRLPTRFALAFRLVRAQFDQLKGLLIDPVSDFFKSRKDVSPLRRPEIMEAFFEGYLSKLEALRRSYCGKEGSPPPHLRSLGDAEELLAATSEVLAEFQGAVDSFADTLKDRAFR